MQGGRATGVKEREKKKRSERESKKKTQRTNLQGKYRWARRGRTIRSGRRVFEARCCGVSEQGGCERESSR